MTALNVPGVSTARKSHRNDHGLQTPINRPPRPGIRCKKSATELRTEETALKKIVIVSSDSERDACFLELVKTLFPDCEICVVPTRGETLAHCGADSFPGVVPTNAIGRA